MTLPLRRTTAEFEEFKREWDAKHKPPSDLSPAQQIALLTIRRTALAREVAGRLKSSTVRASHGDFESLTTRGLAIRHTSGKFLIVTYQGKVIADTIARQLAKDLGLHFFTVGRDRLHHRIWCCCGWSHAFSASTYHVNRINAEWMAKHLRNVKVDKASVVQGGEAEEWTEWPAAEPQEIRAGAIR